MRAHPLPPATQGRDEGSVRTPRGGTAHRRIATCLLVGSTLVAVLSGCQQDEGIAVQTTDTDTGTASPSPTVSVNTSASSSPASDQEAILSQYRTFWSSLTTVSRMPAAKRRATLVPYTVDPELTSLLAGLVATDRKGQVFYGADVPRATTASVALRDQVTAVVNDCQDSTRAGVARRSDLAPLTRGVARNHVVATMKQSSGVWKVSFVAHTTTPC